MKITNIWAKLKKTTADNTVHYENDYSYIHYTANKIQVERIYLQHDTEGLWVCCKQPRNKSGWTRPCPIGGCLDYVLIEND